MELMRLNKFLSDAGVCSRREADRLTEQGLVTVDGEQAELGMKITPDARVKVRGVLVRQETKKVLIALNKPAGIVCTAQKRERNNVIDFIRYPLRVFPVGRLDKDSTGLLLLTNDGELVNKIMRSGNYHEKEYVVTINKPVTMEFCRKMASGVKILDTVTRPCQVIKTGECEFRIVLTQGLNRQIRRMCHALGCEVKTLKRVRIMNIYLGDLKEGSIREIQGKELEELKSLLFNSSSLSVKQRKEGKTDNNSKNCGKIKKGGK